MIPNGARLVALFLAAGWPLLAQGAAQVLRPMLDLQLELDPATRRLHALAVVTPASRDFRFKLHQSLTISAASVDGKKLALQPAGQAGAVRVWRAALPSAASKLRLEYGGILPALDRGLDERGVLQGLPPMASEQGNFLPAGGAWYPQPAALFSYRVALSLPAGQRGLVAGRLQSEEIPARGSGRYRARFEFAHPADGIDLMAGPWVVRERIVRRAGAEPLRLRTYFTPELDGMPGLADAYLEDSQRYLELYGGMIGAYPFTEFSVVASPLPTGFGMPTLTYLGAEVLKLPFIRAVSLGHEVLHNWWGNGVYVDYAAGNWAEGLTTFMADYAYKERESAQAARDMRQGWLRDFAAVPPGAHQSLASFLSRTHGAAAAVGYGKSAMLFFMLRDTIGDDAFQRGIKAFWARHRFAAASWNDLRGAFELASGRPLGPFFDQWLNRTGGPAVKLAQAELRQQAGKAALSVKLEQGEPSYALRLPLEIAYSGRAEIRWLELEQSAQTFTLELPDQPLGVRLDPELRIWRVLEREQLPPILRQWLIARAPRLAIVAQAPDARAAAESLAARVFEAPPRTVALPEAARGSEPTLLVGLHAEVDAALADAAMPPRPASLSGRGTAQFWTIDRPGAAPVAVVSARDVGALRALLRPLPHYGSQSWLVFDGARMIERGVWPAPGKLIPVR